MAHEERYGACLFADQNLEIHGSVSASPGKVASSHNDLSILFEDNGNDMNHCTNYKGVHN